ncbi:hypothetical protein ACTHRK_04875 [Dietzia cercidiphylli]|uniref:hypothetical protein n=1 Tax=Dietzia cercidiphylli TaxID=498199 RepID=UPI003F7FEEA2
MSDDTTTEAHEPTEPTEAPADDQPQPENKAGKEAAKYRTRLRETEAQRDALAEQVTALRRAAVDDRVKAHKVPTEGFWASGVTLEELLDDDGNLNDDKIKTAADTAVETLGLERIGARGPYVPKEGRTTSPRPTQSWESAFSPQ